MPNEKYDRQSDSAFNDRKLKQKRKIYKQFVTEKEHMWENDENIDVAPVLNSLSDF